MVDDVGFNGSAAPINNGIVRNVNNQIPIDNGGIDIASKLAGTGNSEKKLTRAEAKELVKAYMEANDVNMKKAREAFKKEFGYEMPTTVAQKIGNVMINALSKGALYGSPVGSMGEILMGTLTSGIIEKVCDKMTANGETWGDNSPGMLLPGNDDELDWEPVSSTSLPEVTIIDEKKKNFIQKFAQNFLNEMINMTKGPLK